MRFLTVTALLSLSIACFASAQSTQAVKRLDVEGIRHLHRRGALRSWRWPVEIKLDVCGDSEEELFLAVSGFSRGMTYALFTQQGHSWRLLADSIDCTAGMLDVLTAEHHGYRDFAAFQRSGRGGFLVRVFSWSGDRYTERTNWEMTHDQLYGRH